MAGLPAMRPERPECDVALVRGFVVDRGPQGAQAVETDDPEMGGQRAGVVHVARAAIEAAQSAQLRGEEVRRACHQCAQPGRARRGIHPRQLERGLRFVARHDPSAGIVEPIGFEAISPATPASAGASIARSKSFRTTTSMVHVDRRHSNERISTPPP